MKCRVFYQQYNPETGHWRSYSKGERAVSFHNIMQYKGVVESATYKQSPLTGQISFTIVLLRSWMNDRVVYKTIDQ